jgi:hypothetical protein
VSAFTKLHYGTLLLAASTASQHELDLCLLLLLSCSCLLGCTTARLAPASSSIAAPSCWPPQPHHNTHLQVPTRLAPSVVIVLQLFAGLHHGAPGSSKLPEWPPAGSIGSLGMGMGMSPGHMMMFGTPPLGRSVDMVDVCTQLMEAGGEWLLLLLAGWRGVGLALRIPGYVQVKQACVMHALWMCVRC